VTEAEAINTKDEKWRLLTEICNACKKCDQRMYQNKVIGKGSQKAKILFVGEAPGEFENNESMPFVNKAGKLLDEFMKSINLSLDNTYITNILKCRSSLNRAPLKSEQDNCINYLKAQIKLIEPKIIVCLGTTAAMQLIKLNFKITSEHGKWFVKDDINIIAVFHPSALLYDPSREADMHLDFKSIQEKAIELKLIEA